jgi:hypothetical protein
LMPFGVRGDERACAAVTAPPRAAKRSRRC